MKKILFSLLFLLVSFIGYGQFINTTTTGNPTTLFKSRGGLGADSAFILLNNYADTTAANFSVASKYSGSFIRVDTSIYYRTLNPNKWNLFAKVGSTGTIVSISQGYGIVNSPNPITTTGTVTVDTLAISTKANVQKVKDSVIGVLGSYVQLQQSPQVAQTGGLRVTDTIRTSGLVRAQTGRIEGNLTVLGANATVQSLFAGAIGGGVFLGNNSALWVDQNASPGNYRQIVGTDFSDTISIGGSSLPMKYMSSSPMKFVSGSNRLEMPLKNGVLATTTDTSSANTNLFVRLQTGNLFRQDGKSYWSDSVVTDGVVKGNRVIGDSIVGTTGVRGVAGLFTSRLTMGSNVVNDSSIYFTQVMAGDDNFYIFGTGTLLDRGELVFKVGDNGVPYASGGQRFRFSYDTVSGSGIPKDVFIIDYNNITTPNSITAINGDLIGSSDTAAMKATITLDRVLQAGNLSGRGFTVGASNFNGLLRGYEKSFFTTSATGATDTVVSIVSAASGPAMVVSNTNGQAVRVVSSGGATALTAISTNVNGTALDIGQTALGRMISANNGSSNVFIVENSGKTLIKDSIVLDVNNKNYYGKNAANTSVIQLIGTNTSDQINIASGGNQVNVGGKGVFSDSIVANGARFTAGVTVGGNLSATNGSFNGTITGGGTLLVVPGNSRYALDFSTGQTRLFSFGSDGSTNGGFKINSQRSDGSNSTDYLDISTTGQLTIFGNIFTLASYNQTVGATNRDLFVDNTGLVGYVSSIRASKKNIQPMTGAKWIYSLAPTTFNYRKKDSTGKYTDSVYKEQEYGLIAEEVEKVNPEMVFYDKDSTGKHLRGVSYSKLMIPLLAEVQQLRKELDEAKLIINQLKSIAGEARLRKTRR